jgi:hypothetical protein
MNSTVNGPRLTGRPTAPRSRDFRRIALGGAFGLEQAALNLVA